MSASPAKARVLIVDDTPANRLAFEAILEKDYTVSLAESGERALELCRTQEFAVIVLDVRMPGMDGFETSKALRGREGTSTTPIIIFTTAFDQNISQIMRGFSAGATDFLFSPVEPDLLKLKVATYARIYEQFQVLRLQIMKLVQELAETQAEMARHGLTVKRPPQSATG